MEPPGGRDSRFNLGYSMNLLSGETPPEIYGNPSLGRPSTSLQQLSPRHSMVSSACGGRGSGSASGLKSDVCSYDERGVPPSSHQSGGGGGGGMSGLDNCNVNDISDDTYSMQSKKSPPSNGKKTKGRVKIKMEYIENKLRRYTTFSKRKTGIMKKAYELSTLTGTQVMLLVASETGHVYTFATRKLQPMITSEAGKALIQTCLNSPDPPAGAAGGDQRMSATGFEETELTYNISDEDSKDDNGSGNESSDSFSDNEAHDDEPHMSTIYIPPNPIKSEKITTPVNGSSGPVKIKKSSSPPLSSASISLSSASPASSQSGSSTTTASSTSTTTASTSNSTILSPLVYQTPQGMMYATPSNGGVILSLAQGNGEAGTQFITIPLSMVTAQNGQGELDLTKRK